MGILWESEYLKRKHHQYMDYLPIKCFVKVASCYFSTKDLLDP